MGPRPQCYIPSHKVIGPLVLEKKIFEGFLPYMGMAAILVMWPRPHEQLSFPHPIKAPYEIWLRLAQRFWRRRSLKMVDRQRTDDRPWLYYKLTNEHKDSGELKQYRNDPKFSDRYAWANSADPGQTAPTGAVWSGSTLFAILSASFGLNTLW